MPMRNLIQDSTLNGPQMMFILAQDGMIQSRRHLFEPHDDDGQRVIGSLRPGSCITQANRAPARIIGCKTGCKVP